MGRSIISLQLVLGASAILCAGEPVRFVDVAPAAGLTDVIYAGGTEKDHILESVGSGAAFLDFDADGRLDIYLVNGWALEETPSRVRIRGRNRLYRNNGNGTFEDVTERARVGDAGWGCGVCAGDYDNDGRIDIYVTNFGPNVLFRNLGHGVFEEVAAAAGVDEPGWGAGASFFDADSDGDLDLYVANYIEATLDEVLAARRTTNWRNRIKVMTGPFGLRGGRDRFFRNNGDGTFEDATEAAGLVDMAEGYGLGVLASDLDNDGDVDLYVANDSNPNYLYRNDGSGTFTEVGLFSGAGFSADGAAQAGMGVDAADFDGDGRQDLFVTNFARDHSTLYRNAGDLFFDDVTVEHDIKQATYEALSWGCGFFDADLDADVDLLVVNGHIYPQVDLAPDLDESYAQRLIFFINDDGRFREAAIGGSGGSRRVSGRSLALGDYDEDGDMDALITGMDAPPLLLRNDTTTANHWVGLRLRNRHDAPALNARAKITTGGRVQMREVRSGSTYVSQSSLDLHFGLGRHATIDRLEVWWPDGKRTTLSDVSVDRVHVLRHPDASAGAPPMPHPRRPEPKPAPKQPPATPTEPPRAERPG